MVKLDPRTWFNKDGFQKKVAAAHDFIEDIKKQKCPSCNKPTLTPILTEKGKNGWEARVECQSCKVRAVFNDTGFQVGTSLPEKEAQQ